jgi:uncharacterized membrane protein YhhN
MAYILVVIGLIIAVVDWYAVYTQHKKLEYFAKPGVMVALILWMLMNGGLGSTLIWFTLGLAFSMAGDIFLMLPRERFIAGLVSFLLAHLMYIAGLNQTPPAINLPAVIVAVLVALTWLRIYRAISTGLVASGNTALKYPVLAYSLVISLMLLSALLTLTGETWQPAPALLVSGGALLFFLSDTLLAWNKFVTPLRNGRLAVIITYHLGQILIALGAVLHFSSLVPV